MEFKVSFITMDEKQHNTLDASLHKLKLLEALHIYTSVLGVVFVLETIGSNPILSHWVHV